MIKQNVIMIFKTNCYKININVMKRRKSEGDTYEEIE